MTTLVIMIITCVEHPDLAEDGGQDVAILVAHLPDQALGRAPQGDHQVSHGQVHQVVVHRGPEWIIKIMNFGFIFSQSGCIL